MRVYGGAGASRHRASAGLVGHLWVRLARARALGTLGLCSGGPGLGSRGAGERLSGAGEGQVGRPGGGNGHRGGGGYQGVGSSLVLRLGGVRAWGFYGDVSLGMGPLGWFGGGVVRHKEERQR